MDILSRGSFVPLDNRERIEQLIFTAKTLAEETAKAESFQSNGHTNPQLAIEMWKGVEYVCRANEEATIKNLFLSNFLQKLNQVPRETTSDAPKTPPQIQQPQSRPEPQSPMQISEPVATPQTDTVEELPAATSDEPSAIDEPEETIPKRSYSDECKPECEDEIVEMTNGSVEHLALSETNESNPLEIDYTIESEAEPSAQAEDQNRKVPASEPKELTVELDPEYAGDTVPQRQNVESIVLAEKEPFNFDACTITAVLQLLPVKGGLRKCVVSVRSHEFPPQITIDELTVGQISSEVKQSLGNAITKYRSELPVLAVEKMKQDAKSSKNRATKPASSPKPAKAVVGKEATVTKAAESAVHSATETEQSKDQQTLFAQ